MGAWSGGFTLPPKTSYKTGPDLPEQPLFLQMYGFSSQCGRWIGLLSSATGELHKR